MLWVRNDLMEKAGIDGVPRTWDQLRDAAAKMQGGGIYGAPLPYARNSMTSLVFICFVHGAGGMIFSPSSRSPSIRPSSATRSSSTSRCASSARGATAYSWGESLTAFVSGATATGLYTGRVLANVNAQNPGIADSVSAHLYPTVSAGRAALDLQRLPLG